MAGISAEPKSAATHQIVAFDTPVGRCSISWFRDRITQVAIHADDAPENSADQLEPPPWIASAVEQVQRHLHGEPQQLAELPIALDGVSPFRRRVYRAARAIPPGRTVSYGQLAERAGSPGGARAVGHAMRTNPFPIVVPCHRVLPADGSLGAYSAGMGPATKAHLLALEDAWPRGQAFSTNGKESGLAFDAGAARAHLLWLDPAFRDVIAQAGPIALATTKRTTPFAGLFEAIVYQQLTDKAAGTILKRVLAIFRPRRFPRPEDILAVPKARLRSAGLSRNKIAAVKDLAARALDGTVPSRRALARMTDDAIVDRLSTIRGIGRWTVEMLLIFRLGRPDVLPADDLGVRKGYARVFGGALPEPRAVLAHGEDWKPFRSAASWYLWRAVDLLP